MRIAFDMYSPQGPWEIVRKSAEAHLKLLQLKGVDIRELLGEMARFYGILVPVGEKYWQFAHRTVHDYLSARYWVESGNFRPNAAMEWDIHSAYAACLTPDATPSMLLMLEREKDHSTFAECLYNMAPFEADIVARAIINRAAGVHNWNNRGNLADYKPPILLRLEDRFTVKTQEDIYHVSSTEFLRTLLRQALAVETWAGEYHRDRARVGAEAVAVFAVAELFHRNAKIRPKDAAQFMRLLHAPIPAEFLCQLGNRTIRFLAEDLAAKTAVDESSLGA